MTVKIGGETRDMTVREVMRLQSLEQESRKRMTDADHAKRQAMALFHLAKTDPDRFFEITGIDADAYSEARLERKIKMLQETPEQRELRELREERERRLEVEKQARVKAEQERSSRLEQEAMQNFNKEFVDAWRDSGYPEDKWFGQLLAQEMVAAHDRGEELNWKEAAAKLKVAFPRRVRGVLEQMDAKAIQEFLGDKVLKMLREADIRRVTQAPPSPVSGVRLQPGSDGGTPAPSRKRDRPLSEKEYRQWVESLKG